MSANIYRVRIVDIDKAKAITYRQYVIHCSVSQFEALKQGAKRARTQTMFQITNDEHQNHSNGSNKKTEKKLNRYEEEIVFD